MSGNTPGFSRTKTKKFKDVDTAILKKPISTNTTGLKQALHILHTGAPNVKHMLIQEANIIYECKVCLSMFRSVANFLDHKRNFCRAESESVMHLYSEDDYEGDSNVVVVQPEEVSSDPTTDGSWNLENYSPSLELLKTEGLLEDILLTSNPDMYNPNKNILAVTNRLKHLAKVSEQSNYSELRANRQNIQRYPNTGTVILEAVGTSKKAHYQTFSVTSANGKDTMKDYHDKINAFSDLNNHVIVLPKKEDDSPAVKLERRYPCLFCATVFARLDAVKRHFDKQHPAEDFQSLKAKIKRKAIVKAVNDDGGGGYGAAKSSDSVALDAITKSIHHTPIKPLRIDISKSSVTPQQIKALGLEEKPEDIVPKAVEDKIMELIHRRNLQCRECYKKFRTTKLAQQHVAREHLQFHRFKCSLCGHGTWLREHMLKHLQANHRKTNKEDLIEQSVEEYFMMPTPRKVEKIIRSTSSLTPLKKVEIRTSPVKLLAENLSNLDRKEKSPSNHSDESEQELLPSSLLTGLKDQIRLSLENDPSSSGNTSDAGSDDNNHATNPPPLSVVAGVVAHEVPATNKRKARLAAAPPLLPSTRERSPVKTLIPATVGGGVGGGSVGRMAKRKRDSSSSSSSGGSSSAGGCGGEDGGSNINSRSSRSQVNGDAGNSMILIDTREMNGRMKSPTKEESKKLPPRKRSSRGGEAKDNHQDKAIQDTLKRNSIATKHI